VTATIGVGSGPDGVAVDPKTNTVYVANGDSGTVSCCLPARDDQRAPLLAAYVPVRRVPVVTNDSLNTPMSRAWPGHTGALGSLRPMRGLRQLCARFSAAVPAR